MEWREGRGSEHRKGEEVPIYNSCQENYHQHRGIWNELLIVAWKLYVKTCSLGVMMDRVCSKRVQGQKKQPQNCLLRQEDVFPERLMEINSLLGEH